MPPVTFWRRVTRLVAAAASLAGLGASGSALAGPATGDAGQPSAAAPADGNKLVEPSLLAEAQAVAPGQKVAVALRFKIADGWHVYWPGLNDSGAPLEPGPIVQSISGSTACPAAFSDWRWPAPSRHLLPGDILDYVFEGELILLSEFTVPASATPGQIIELSVRPNWLVCSEACIPGKGAASLRLPVAEKPLPGTPEAVALLAAARARLPRDPAPADALAITWSGRTATLRLPGAKRLAFAPAEASVAIENPIATGAGEGETLTLTVPPDARGSTLQGVLSVVPASGPAFSLNIRAGLAQPVADPAAPASK